MKKYGFILFSLGVGFLCAQEKAQNKAQVQVQVIPPVAPPAAAQPTTPPPESAPPAKAPAPAEVNLDFSEAKITAAIQDWNAEDRALREKASDHLEAWVHNDPAQAKKRLLSILRDNPQPEARERSVKLLKIIAATEFDKTGPGYIGVSLGQAAMVLKHPQDQSTLIGLPIAAVSPGSPAEKFGVKPGDIVVSVDDFRWAAAEQITDLDHGLSAKIRAKGAGTTVNFGMLRNDQIVKVPVTLMRRPMNLEQLPVDPAVINGIIQGGIKLDKESIDDLIAEEKNSPEYFAEWLDHQLQAAAAK